MVDASTSILNEQESHGIFIFVSNIVMGLRVQSKVKRTKAEPIKAKSMANAKVNKQLAYCLCVFFYAYLIEMCASVNGDVDIVIVIVITVSP